MRKLLALPLFLMMFVACQQKEIHTNTVFMPQDNPIQTTVHGDETGNGGDQVVVSFKSSAQDVIDLIESDPSEGMNVDTTRLKAMLDGQGGERLIIVSTSEVLVDKFGEVKEALNFPNGKTKDAKPQIKIDDADLGNPLIVLNKSAWEKHIKFNLDLRLLVFHELIPVIGQLDDNGEMSKKFKELIKKERIRNIERFYGRRVETRMPQEIDGALPASILYEEKIVNELEKLQKHIEEKTGRAQVLGMYPAIEFFYVSELKGRYQLFRDGINLKRTSVYSYPVEKIVDGEVIKTTPVLEIKKNEFDKLYIDDQVLEIFIAILHLREADIDLEEMEKLIEIANDFYPIPLPIRNPGRVNLN